MGPPGPWVFTACIASVQSVQWTHHWKKPSPINSHAPRTHILLQIKFSISSKRNFAWFLIGEFPQPAICFCMAVRLLAYQVADLCLGKPPLRSLSSAATVADALAAVKVSDENFVSVWSCDHSEKRNLDCVCVGKVCMVDIVCYLCREENLSSPGSALRSPISVLLSKVEGLVRHVEPSSR